MAKRKNKTTEKYTPDTAPVEYTEDQVVEVSESTANENESSLSVSDDGVEEEVEEEKTEIKENSEKVSSSGNEKSKALFPQSFYKSLMKVRIIGKREGSGNHMMYPLAIANAVVRSIGGGYSIIVGEQSLVSICALIENNEIDATLDEKRKKIIIERFKAENKRYKK